MNLENYDPNSDAFAAAVRQLLGMTPTGKKSSASSSSDGASDKENASNYITSKEKKHRQRILEYKAQLSDISPYTSPMSMFQHQMTPVAVVGTVPILATTLDTNRSPQTRTSYASISPKSRRSSGLGSSVHGEINRTPTGQVSNGLKIYSAVGTDSSASSSISEMTAQSSNSVGSYIRHSNVERPCALASQELSPAESSVCSDYGATWCDVASVGSSNSRSKLSPLSFGVPNNACLSVAAAVPTSMPMRDNLLYTPASGRQSVDKGVSPAAITPALSELSTSSAYDSLTDEAVTFFVLEEVCDSQVGINPTSPYSDQNHISHTYSCEENGSFDEVAAEFEVQDPMSSSTCIAFLPGVTQDQVDAAEEVRTSKESVSPMDAQDESQTDNISSNVSSAVKSVLSASPTYVQPVRSPFPYPTPFSSSVSRNATPAPVTPAVVAGNSISALRRCAMPDDQDTLNKSNLTPRVASVLGLPTPGTTTSAITTESDDTWGANPVGFLSMSEARRIADESTSPALSTSGDTTEAATNDSPARDVLIAQKEQFSEEQHECGDDAFNGSQTQSSFNDANKDLSIAISPHLATPKSTESCQAVSYPKNMYFSPAPALPRTAATMPNPRKSVAWFTPIESPLPSVKTDCVQFHPELHAAVTSVNTFLGKDVMSSSFIHNTAINDGKLQKINGLTTYVCASTDPKTAAPTSARSTAVVSDNRMRTVASISTIAALALTISMVMLNQYTSAPVGSELFGPAKATNAFVPANTKTALVFKDSLDVNAAMGSQHQSILNDLNVIETNTHPDISVESSALNLSEAIVNAVAVQPSSAPSVNSVDVGFLVPDVSSILPSIDIPENFIQSAVVKTNDFVASEAAESMESVAVPTTVLPPATDKGPLLQVLDSTKYIQVKRMLSASVRRQGMPTFVVGPLKRVKSQNVDILPEAAQNPASLVPSSTDVLISSEPIASKVLSNVADGVVAMESVNSDPNTVVADLSTAPVLEHVEAQLIDLKALVKEVEMLVPVTDTALNLQQSQSTRTAPEPVHVRMQETVSTPDVQTQASSNVTSLLLTGLLPTMLLCLSAWGSVLWKETLSVTLQSSWYGTSATETVSLESMPDVSDGDARAVSDHSDTPIKSNTSAVSRKKRISEGVTSTPLRRSTRATTRQRIAVTAPR